MKIRKTKCEDYRRDVVFEVFARYRTHIIFSDDLRKSCIYRYGQCKIDIENAVGFVKHATDGRSHIFLPPRADSGTIAHEAWHVVYRMFDYIGVKDFDNETTAYHLGYLVEQIHKFQNEVMNHVSEASTSCGSANRLQGLHAESKTKTS